MWMLAVVSVLVVGRALLVLVSVMVMGPGSDRVYATASPAVKCRPTDGRF
jgi:hypothetical protein